MSDQNNIVYVVDPDEAVHDALTELLVAAGIRVVSFCSAEEFLEMTEECGAVQGCLLAEANLPGMGSLALLRQLRARDVSIPVVILTSTASRDIVDQAFKAGAVEVIAKPLVGDRLLGLLRNLTGQTSANEISKNGQGHA